MRAIDEAVRFLNLGYGDRLGHAFALGIDIKQWYEQNTVVFSRLYRSADDSDKVDINNYYNALKIRGDDPSLYENRYFDKRRMEYCRQPYLVNEIYPEAYEFVS